MTRQVEPGFARGRHYTEWVPTVKELRRANRNAEAEALLLELVDATEREALEEDWGGPAPWYYEQLAIIYRSRKDFAGEISIVERYLRQETKPTSSSPALRRRLEKARVMQQGAN
jgi:hypothetical protein